ncbi:MAG: bacterial proteasome activator family protein [Marmoricola sp.]
MTQSPHASADGPSTPEEEPRIMVIGPNGMAAQSLGDDEDSEGTSVTNLVEEPAKVMRIGSMIRQLLEEVKASPLDEPGRKRLAQVLHTSLIELKDGLAPELDEELDRLVQPFDDDTPSESELRIAQAQLVGWLEGLFHGIQTAIYAQQMAARAQLEQMRRSLPAGPAGRMPMPDAEAHQPGGQGGMYL